MPSFPRYALATTSCRLRLRYLDQVQTRLQKVAASGREPAHKFFYPADYHSGEKRNVLIYLPGFGSGVEAYAGVQGKISRAYAEMDLPEPIVLSLSMGPSALAGVPEHGLNSANFVPVSDYWGKVETALDELPFDVRVVSFLANSGGALSAFQMLRFPSRYLTVKKAVFCSFPNFVNGELGPNPSQIGKRSIDPNGTALRAQIQILLLSLSQDRYFDRLVPWAAFHDDTFPTVPILIQAPEFDAFGYTAINESFVQQGVLRGFPLRIRILEGQGQGHGGIFDNFLSVRFLEGIEP